MITKKALIAKLNSLNLDSILVPAYQRSTNYRGRAAELALRPLIAVETFSQQSHVTAKGTVQPNPKWLKQLYTDLAWASGDIKAGDILYALQ